MMQSTSFSSVHTSDSTTRWLRWCVETGGDKSDVASTALRLCAALCHLTDARGALLLQRQSDGDQLRPLVGHFANDQRTFLNGEFDDEDALALDCAQQKNWPAQPLRAHQTPAEWQPTLHALGKLMDEIDAGAALGSSAMAWQEIEADARAGSALQVLAANVFDAQDGQDNRLDSDNVSADVKRAPAQIDVAMQEERRFMSFGARGVPSLLLPLHDFPTAAGASAAGASAAGASAAGASSLCAIVALWFDEENRELAESEQVLVQAALVQSGDWLATAGRMERLGRSYRALANAMARVIDERDPERTNRSSSVAYLCGLIGQALELDDMSIERLEFAGLLHSTGRIALSDKILHRQGALKASERDAVRAALQAGAAWFEEVDGLAEVAQMIRHQNERFDGSGFPDGLQGEQIPLGSRVLAIALRFAAMTQPRAQRAALPLVGGAFQNLRAEAGSALDPQIVSAFFRAMGEKER